MNIKSMQSSPAAAATLFSSSQQEVSELIPLLVTLTPTDVSPGYSKRSFQQENFSELPPIPNFAKHPELFAKYITLLTHTTFYYRKSSLLNGVIPKILRNLMHPGNLKTLPLRNADVYNDVIFFYSQRSDYASCRELFSQMKLEAIKPNTTTFNLLLRNTLKNSHIRKKEPSLKEAIYHLKQMLHHGVKADSVTWVTCYNLLLDNMSRDVFLEKLIECHVPITPQLVLAVMTSSNENSSRVLKFLSEHSVPLDSKLFNFCMKRLLDEGKCEAAWAFLNHAHKNVSFKLNQESLNIFLRSFAESGRLDLALLTFNTATRQFKIAATLNSFDMLLKALVRNGYTSNFPTIFEYLCRKRRHHTHGVQVYSYWLSKAQLIVKFNMKSQANETKIERANKLLDNAIWDSDGLKWKCWNECKPSYRKLFRFLGCVPTTLKPTRKTSIFDTTTEVSAKKLECKNRIRSIAVRSAMQKRLPYAKDRYPALKTELHNRGLLNID